MAKRPNFNRLALTPGTAETRAPVEVSATEPAKPNLKQRSKPVMLYLHPAGHKALKLYSVEAGKPMHDLLLEAVEDWSRKHGITAPIRADSR